jgi:hypothetical protein
VPALVLNGGFEHGIRATRAARYGSNGRWQRHSADRQSTDHVVAHD